MPDQSGSPDRHRLARTVIPSRYEISLEPDLDAASFDGKVAISVELAEPLDAITLNAAELDIDTATAVLTDGTTAELEVSYDADAEQITCVFIDEPAPAGLATLEFGFRGTLNDKLRGFYRSQFTDADGIERTIATTQFESTDARRAFPCFDEPDFKAVFSISLVVPDHLLAISNASETRRQNLGNGKVRVDFADTIEMSTYLVAFVVGPLESTEAVDVDGVPLRVVHPLGKGDLAHFGLEIGASALRTFTDYYGIAYPGDKVDLIAIPDFAFGAMENLGCITFRETALLVDTGTATQPELERVADVVAHELAHMWFGDLVTMRWWNGIWLNEAFATFMEMYAVNEFRPEWKRWSTFALSRSAAFDTDALATTRPIEYPVISPADAEGMFDILTYEKGASVLRMLEQHLGPDEFRNGIHHYLSTHAYGNTETSDLWNALGTATGREVRAIAESWIFQGGHPIVSVARGTESGEVVLSQSLARYLPGPDTARWSVPIGLRWADGNGSEHALDVLLESDEMTVDLGAEPAWLIANRGASGFFRTGYAPELRAALASVALDVLDPTERYTLVDDTWAAVLAGAASISDVVGLVRALADEDDLSVWRRIAGILGTIARLSSGSIESRALVAELVGPLFDRLGPVARDGEDEATTNLRATAFELLGRHGDDHSAVDRAAAIVDRAISGTPTAQDDPSLVDAAVRITAPRLDDTGFDRFLQASRDASTPQDTLRYLAALADVKDPDVFDRFLEMLFSGEVRTQDIGGLLNRSLTNAENVARAWEFTTSHWTELNDRLPSNAISRMVSGVRSVTDAALAERIAEFLTANQVPQAAKAFAQHIERMRVSVALAERERPGIAATISRG